MRKLVLAGLLAVLGAAGAQAAAPASRPPEDAVMCLAPNGTTEPVACTRGSSYGPSDICTCPGLASRVAAPICDKGEAPPVENLAYARARHDAARDGTLFGDTYNGKRMCVQLPKRPR